MSYLIKVYLLWFVLISVLLLSVFVGVLEDAWLQTLAIVFGLAIPVSVVTTFVHKWIIEARLKNLNKQKAKSASTEISNTININKFGNEAVNKFTKFVGILVLLVLFSNLATYLSKVSFFMVFLPILIYEVYRFVIERKNKNLIYSDQRTRKIPTFWIVFGTNIIWIVLNGVSALIWFGPMKLVVIFFLGIFYSSVWIIGRELEREIHDRNVAAETKNNNDFSVPLSIERGIAATVLIRNISLVVLFIIAIPLFIGSSLYDKKSDEAFIENLKEMEAERNEKIRAEFQRVWGTESTEYTTPPPPDPIFDATIKKIKNDLAISLGVEGSDISTVLYKNFTQKIRPEAFCKERRFSIPVALMGLPVDAQPVIRGDVEIKDKQSAIMSTTAENPPALTVPVNLEGELPSHLLFEYRVVKSARFQLIVTFNDTLMDAVDIFVKDASGGNYIQTIIAISDEPTKHPAGEVVPGKNQIKFSLKSVDKNVGGDPSDGSLEISSISLASIVSLPLPCVEEESEKRRIVFRLGEHQYTYVIDVSGRYFYRPVSKFDLQL